MKKFFILAVLLTAFAILWTGRRPPEVTPGPGREQRVLAAHGERDFRRDLIPRLSREASTMWQWAAEYTAAGEDERAAMLEPGKAIATAHRARMKTLITGDPRRALEEALPVALRQDLPAKIAGIIEQRVNARGFYGVLGSTEGGIRRTFQTADGREYEAFVFGRRVRQRTTENAAAHGVALDDVLALDEDPLRPMEPGERLHAEQPVFFNCPVSGKITSAQNEITPETPAVEVGGEIHLLCTGGHIHALREELIAAEGGTGGPSKPTGAVPSSWTTGVKSVLYIRVTFPEQWTDPQPEKDSYDMMKSVNDFFVENSHGALHLMTTVTPLLTMPKPESWYKANDGTSAYTVLSDARNVARAAGFDYAAYDLEAVRYSGASGSFGGQAYVGGRGCWLKSSSAGVAAHEFGHNLGLWHANYWSTSGESVVGSGSNSEYGNAFDTMGSASAGNYSFNAGHQNDLRWIPDENVTRVNDSGMFRLQQFDQGRLDPASRYLLMIRKDAQRDYWCEFRQKWTTNAWLMNGVQVNWSPWGDGSTASTAYGSNGGGQLLDMTPGSLDGKNDSPIVLGRTFSDAGAQVHITPVSKAGTVPESVDVVVNIGAFPGNQPPSLELSAGTLTAALNAPVTFTATSLDPDGDALAYSWDWGDRTFGANAAVVTKAWSTAGLYTVRCEVSDLRGGTRSALLAITVGTPAQWRIGGRVLTAAGEPLAGVRVSSVQTSSTGTNPRATITDSEGNYLLSGLPAETYTLTAASPTHTVTAGFTIPIIITDSDVTAGYTASSKPTVTMTLPDDSCTENGDTATLRFTRTAATNAGAIEARVFVGGSANMSDVDFVPAETYELTTYKFTIPDGQPFLDVAVTAYNDSTAEGPETISFYLIDGSGYVPAGVEHVTLLVNDDDTTLPVVSIEATDATATEGGDGATLRVSRTGPLDAALVVSLTRSGTAITATDYTGINTTATIPAGESSTSLELNTLQDNAAEGSETATFSIVSSATWIRAPLQYTASVIILDDDISTVSITAADAAASEANSDPAVLVITRTGDLSAAITVDYAPGGTAQHGTDYQPLPGTITIPAGLANAALVITPVDDAIGEASQTITVQLRSAARYLVGAAFSATATLADNDQPHLMATVSDGSCDEAGGTGKFKIQSYASGSGNTTVLYTITGSATSGVDFTAVSGTALVPKGGFTEITITPIQDAEFEDAETITLTLLPDAGYTLSPENDATLMLVDDDQPLVSVAAASTSYSESTGGLARFYFARNGATTAALSVTYSLGGTATPGIDYTAPSGTITIPAAAAGAALDVSLLDDTEAEGSESIICTVLSTPGTQGANIASATTWITDSDAASLPEVRFATGTSAASEDAGTLNIPVTLAFAAPVEVRVDYALESGLAFNGVDYVASGGTLVFAPGEATQNIAVTLLDDIFNEPAESLTLRLVRAAGARPASVTSHAITIVDNDTLPPAVIGFTTTNSAAGEGAGTPPLALVFLSAPQPAAFSVTWTVTGGTATAADAVAMSGSLSFQPGETAKPVPLTLIDDALREPSETLVISLSEPSAPATLAPIATHTLTVSDNDDTSLSIIASDASAAEEATEPGVFTITRVSANLTQPITVALTLTGTATNGDDFTPLPAEIIIPANAASVSLSVTPLDDAILDPSETVTLNLAPSPFYAVGSPASATITITDNETGVSIAATDASVSEPSDGGSFTLSRIGPAAGELTIPLTTGGTAAAEDFTPLPAIVVLSSGQTTAVVNVTPLDDFTAEPDETVTLTIEPGPGYVISTATASMTIHDDDTNLAPVVTIQSPANGSVFLPRGPGLMLDASVGDDGRPFPTSPLSVNWSLLSGPGSVTFGDSNAVDTTAQFSAPGQYVLRLAAADAELTTTANLNVFVLSDTLTGVNIGTTSAGTGLAGSASAWTLTGAGAGVTSTTTDGCYFAHRQMSGDFTVIARVNSILPANASTSSRCGVMVRSALTPGSRHAFMATRPATASFVWRTTDGASGTTSTTGTLTPALPRFVRLKRTGNSFTAAHSLDGLTWTTQGSAQTIAMPDPVYVGLAATSASTTASTTVTAAFDSFSLTRTGNTAPFVDAGLPQSTSLAATLAGFVSDDTGPPPLLWEKLSGPGSVILPAAATGTANFTAPGLYTLRLSSDDGSARTFDDTTYSVVSPFSEWQTQHFGAGADPLISGPRADPDSDGLENLAEYALRSDPLNSDTSATPVSSRSATTLSMTWREATAATDTLIQPQWTDDLATWDSAALTIETLSADTGWIEKRATLDISARPRAALRVLVTLP